MDESAFDAYNGAMSPRKTIIGNWFEERKLEELTGHNRFPVSCTLCETPAEHSHTVYVIIQGQGVASDSCRAAHKLGRVNNNCRSAPLACEQTWAPLKDGNTTVYATKAKLPVVPTQPRVMCTENSTVRDSSLCMSSHLRIPRERIW